MENDDEVGFQRAGNPHIFCSIHHVFSASWRRPREAVGTGAAGSPMPQLPSSRPRGRGSVPFCSDRVKHDFSPGWLLFSALPFHRLFLFLAVKRVKKGIVSIMVIKLPGNSLIRLIKSK